MRSTIEQSLSLSSEFDPTSSRTSPLQVEVLEFAELYWAVTMLTDFAMEQRANGCLQFIHEN